MGTGRAISMPGLLQLKYAHLHAHEATDDKVSHRSSGAASVSGSDAPNKGHFWLILPSPCPVCGVLVKAV